MALNITLLLLLLLPKSHVCFPEEKKVCHNNTHQIPWVAVYEYYADKNTSYAPSQKVNVLFSIFSCNILYSKETLPFSRPAARNTVLFIKMNCLDFPLKSGITCTCVQLSLKFMIHLCIHIVCMFSTNKHEANSSQAFSTTQNKFSKRKYASKIHNKVTLNWFAQRKKVKTFCTRLYCSDQRILNMCTRVVCTDVDEDDVHCESCKNSRFLSV